MRGIYTIINNENGKVYIGKAEDLLKRRREHFSTLRNGTHHNRHLQRAFNKYGESKFAFIVLYYADEHTNLIDLEIETIAEYDSTNIRKGYNMTSGGDGIGGFKHTKEARKRMSEARQGLVVSDEARKKDF